MLKSLPKNAWGISPYGIVQPWGTRYSRHKAQAKFRGEPYELTAEEYHMVWLKSGKHTEIGTGKHNWVLKRLDERAPWHVSNVAVVPRNCYSQSKRRRYTDVGYQQT